MPRNFSIPNPDRFVVFLAGIVALAIVTGSSGCKSIRALRVEHDQPRILTPEEAVRELQDGWDLFQRLPRALPTITQASIKLEHAALNLPDHFDAHVKAATVLAYLSEHDPRVSFRMQAAKHGIAMARKAREIEPNRVEGHYLYALNVGLLADVDRDYGLDAVDEMMLALNRARELDPAYDDAGPLRLLGLLYLRAPGPPVSVGSKRRALQVLQQATELCPTFPENYLYLAEAQRDLGRLADARASLEKVLSVSTPPGFESEHPLWKEQARKLLDSLGK